VAADGVGVGIVAGQVFNITHHIGVSLDLTFSTVAQLVALSAVLVR
jgi:hypothetical protein